MDVTKQHLAHIEAIEKLSARWARYLTANIDKTIAPNDDMFVAGELDHYLFVGVSALQVVSEAMLLAEDRSAENTGSALRVRKSHPPFR